MVMNDEMNISDTHPLLLDNLAKAQTSPDKYLDAGVRVLPGAGMRGAREHPFSYSEAINLYSSWIYAAVNLNATAVAALPIRLYVRNRRAASKLYRTRGVSHRRRAYLAGDADGPLGAARPHRDTMRKLVDLGSDFEEVQGEHPVLSMIQDANPWYNGFDLLQLLVIYLECTGNAYWHPVFDPDLDMPDSIWPMPSQWTWVVPDEELFIRGYLFGRTRTGAQEFEPDEVIHFRTANPSDEGLWYGKGKIEAAWKVTILNESHHTMDLALADNHARPDYLMIAKSGTTGDALTQLEAKVERKLKGAGKSGRFLGITGDVDLKPLGFTPKDLTGRDEIVEEVAAVFGVPVSLLKANDPNLASAQIGYAAWKSNTIMPLATLIEQKLNERLIPLFGLEGDAVLAFDNPVPADKAFDLQESTARVSNATRTINEDRELRGEPPVQGGDMPRVNGTSLEKLDADQPAFDLPGFRVRPQAPDEATTEEVFVLGNQLGKALGAIETQIKELRDDHQRRQDHDPTYAGKPPGQEIGKTDSDRIVPTADARFDPANSTTGTKAGDETLENQHRTDGTEDRGGGTGSDERRRNDSDRGPATALSYKALMLGVPAKASAADDVREDEPDTPHVQLAAALAQLLAAQEQAVQVVLEGIDTDSPGRSVARMAGTKQLAPAIQEALERAISGLDDALAAEIQDVITRMVQTGGDAGISALGLDDPLTFDTTNPEVVRFLQGYSIRLAGAISDVTLARISDTIESGLTAGNSVQEIASQIHDTGEFSGARAEAIARSETARAYVRGQEIGWDQTGVVEGKKWLLAPDACEFCRAAAAELNKRTTDLNGNFYDRGHTLRGAEGGRMQLDYSDVKGPPLHPNCRCDIQAVLKDS